MKRIALFVFGALAVSTSAFAQMPAAAAAAAPTDPAIATPLMAAPANLRAAATVVKFKPDFTYDTLKKGTNRLVCYDRSGFPQQAAFSLECTSIANLDRVSQNMKFEALGDKVKTQAALDAAEKDGTRVKPEYGSVFYHLMGPDKDHARPHMTISVPGATTATTGLPETGAAGVVWIMNAGTSTAHYMIPGE